MSDAVVLLSGGIDSATTLAIAKHGGCRCHALVFDYGQRHAAELDAARRVAGHVGVASYCVFKLDLGGFGGSALTDAAVAMSVADDSDDSDGSGGSGGSDGSGGSGGSDGSGGSGGTDGTDGTGEIPATYVPARNTIFLAVALARAETLDARDVFIGVNAVDYPGYPDCRPQFIEAFQNMANLATRAGVEGRGPRIAAPLIALSKAEIIRRGVQLGLDYSLTVSCYQADAQGRACGRCDSCRFRRLGFEQAGVPDPARCFAGGE